MSVTDFRFENWTSFRWKLIWWPAIFLLLADCASVPERIGPVAKNDYSYMVRYLDWMVPGRMGRASVPGLSIAVVDGDRIVWSKGYGKADAANSTPVTSQTIYRVGSVSKLLTATAIMRAVEQGQIDLDVPLERQLPGFTIQNRFTDSSPITARTLLSHHGGLPSDRLHGMWETDPTSLQELERLLALEHMVAPAATQYKYSNLGYSLLGRLIEEKGGVLYSQAIKTNLLEPLGMTQSWFERTAHPAMPYAKPHRKGVELAPIGLRDEPAGALLSSVTDMARFVSFVLTDGNVGNQTVLRADTVQSMFEPQFEGLALDFGHRVGLGWMLSGIEVPGAGNIAWHDGQYPGYFSTVLIAREPKLGVVLLANGEDARSFSTQMATKVLALALEAKRGEAPPLPVRPAEAEPVDIAPHQLNAFAGSYVVFGNKSTIVRKGDHLLANLFNTELDLYPLGDDRFRLQKSVLGLVSVPLSEMSLRFSSVDNRSFAVLEGLPVPLAFERIERKQVPAAWQARLGDYICNNSDYTLEFLELRLDVEDTGLVARITASSGVAGVDKSKGTVPLDPISNDVAIMLGVGATEGSVIQAGRHSGKDVLYYSGYTFTRVGDSPLVGVRKKRQKTALTKI